MSAWQNVLEWVAKEEGRLVKGETLVKAAIVGYEGVKSGRHKSVLDAINAELPEAIPIIEDVAGVLGGPLAKIGVEVLVEALAYSQPLVPGSPEEQRGFDQADGTARDGLGNRTDGW